MRRRWTVLLFLFLLPGLALADIACDGVDDVLTSPAALSTLLSTTAYTVTAWIKHSGRLTVLSQCFNADPGVADTNGGTLALGHQGDSGTGVACAYIWDGGNKVVNSGALSLGWHHLAARLSGGTLTLFVDGVSVGSVGVTTPLPDLTGLLTLCGHASSGFGSDRVSQVEVYASALSDNALASLGQSRRRLLPRTAPTAVWPLDGCADGASGNTLSFADRSGNNQPLTGDDGANNTGLTCQASEWISRPWGIQ